MSQDQIVIQGAREHNLKNISLSLPRNKLIVVTGLSGSGKSSLAFDTLYAEGQRRYVESLSSYARLFLDQMNKPDVDAIEGLSPAISIEQKSASHNPRSTVATVTEIYDYLRLLFARIGRQHCPSCGRSVSAFTVQQMADTLLKLEPGTRFTIYAPAVRKRKGEYRKELERFLKDGYIRVRVDGTLHDLTEGLPVLDKKLAHVIEVLVDRLVVKPDIGHRLSDSLELACKLADGLVLVETAAEERFLFSEKAGCPVCGVSLPDLEPRLFSFNNPFGACATCHGLGVEMVFDPELIVPDETLSLAQGAVQPWASPTGFFYSMFLEGVVKHFGGDMRTPYKDLPAAAKKAILHGYAKPLQFSHHSGKRQFSVEKPFEGVIPNLERRWHESTSAMVREELERYMSYTLCPTCEGKRLKPEVLAVTVSGRNIMELTNLSVRQALEFVTTLELTPRERTIAARLVKELTARLGFLSSVGLDYLTLDRASGSLSGGEAQRIRLATQIGSALVGVMYILDEPSIGLHQRDNERLLATLTSLRDLGNTVIVVEHDEDTIRLADHIVDMGPGAGALGGEVVAAGTLDDILANKASLTGRYLTGDLEIPVPHARRPGDWRRLTLHGCTINNLKNIDVTFPLGLFVCVTGVSGSGKSSLVIDTLLPTLAKRLSGKKGCVGCRSVEGLEHIDKVIAIDQSPIGRTPRSNPATYTQVFGAMRELFSELPEAKARGYKPGRFSFNVKGGRCEACEGAGVNRIEMHFLPDLYVPCEACQGKRYNRETLDVRFKGKSISDVLDMTIDEALGLFENVPSIYGKLKLLAEVGLGYIQTGQAATTLSGGEAQRVKLAKELSRRSTGRTLYILDEPTTGLHFHDINQLLSVLLRLVEGGNTVVVIEHNLDVIKTADYLIDLGPEGGHGGGTVLATGTPEEVVACPASYTGRFLKEKLRRRA